jgi:hypothetical protein
VRALVLVSGHDDVFPDQSCRSVRRARGMGRITLYGVRCIVSEFTFCDYLTLRLVVQFKASQNTIILRLLRRRVRQEMWSKFLLLAAVLLRLTGSALAQGYPDVNVPNSDERRRLMLEKMQELRQQKRLDDAYRAARNKVPNQKPSDPWADVRPPPATPAPKNKPQ